MLICALSKEYMAHCTQCHVSHFKNKAVMQILRGDEVSNK